ncbi:MAG: WG repeat-containing protein, partial [Mameliella sp.]|nr:WG repeat-containing protein [Phaeodactylibacter sp.]
MKASLWIFSLCLTFQALGVHKGFAQSSPQWLFAADAPTVQAYHLSASVSDAEEYQAFTKPVRNREAVAYPGEKSSQLFIERGKAGQNWTLFFQEDGLQYALLNERSLWRKCPGTAGLVYDTASLMVISTHLRDFDSLLLWLPDVQASAAIVGLGSKDGNQQFAYLLNEAGWPIAEAHYQSGELLALSTYAYQFDEGGRWTKRFVHNRLSGQQKEVSRYLVEHAGKTGKGWMAVDGGTGFWLLEENGNALYWNGQAMRPLPGSWTKTSEQLTIERKDWTEARRFVIEEFAWGWQVKSEADEQEDWVWTVALDYDIRKLRRWQEAAMVSSYEVFEDKERVGLRDEGGTTQIEAKYDALQPIMPGLAIVGLEDRFGLLQLNGMSLLPIYFERLQYLGDSLLLGQRSGKQGVIHLAGDTILPFEFDRLIAIDEASYWMFQEGKMGMIDNMGNVLIEPEFDLIQPFLDGQALAMADGQTGVIDASGQWIIEPGVYAGVTPVGLSGYLVQTDASSWGFADRSGSLQVAPEYGHLRSVGATTLIAQ